MFTDVYRVTICNGILQERKDSPLLLVHPFTKNCMKSVVFSVVPCNYQSTPCTLDTPSGHRSRGLLERITRFSMYNPPRPKGCGRDNFPPADHMVCVDISTRLVQSNCMQILHHSSLDLRVTLVRTDSDLKIRGQIISVDAY